MYSCISFSRKAASNTLLFQQHRGHKHFLELEYTKRSVLKKMCTTKHDAKHTDSICYCHNFKKKCYFKSILFHKRQYCIKNTWDKKE